MASPTSQRHLSCFAFCVVCLLFFFACSNSNITDVKGSKISGGKVTLSWDNVYNASFYNIYYGDAPGVTKKNGKKISQVKNPHTIKGLESGKTYYFVVTAVKTSGEIKESKESEELSLLVE